MRRGRLLVFDDVIVGTSAVYSSTDFNDFLGQFDSLVLQAVVDTFQSTNAITVQLQASADGRNWINKNDFPEINNLTVGAAQTSVAGVDPGTLGISPGRVRLVVTLGSSNIPVAHVRVWAEGRDIAGPFQPTHLPGCVLWLRGDLGVTTSASTVTSWADSSGSADSNKNLTATGSPTFVASDSSYANECTIHFNGTTDYMLSGVWAKAPPLPYTWIFVAHRTNTSGIDVIICPNDAAGDAGCLVYGDDSAPANTVLDNTSSIKFAQSWTSPSALLCEVNDPNSAMYFNNFTTPQVSGGNVGALAYASLALAGAGMGIGLGALLWPGTIAEVICYDEVLPPASKAVLRSYLIGRYGLAIT